MKTLREAVGKLEERRVDEEDTGEQSNTLSPSTLGSSIS